MGKNDETYVYKSLKQEFRSSLREIDAMDASLAQLGAKRVMIICGENVLNKSDVVRRVEAAIAPLIVGRFDGVKPHSPVEVVEAACEMANELQPDTLVSVGGGSAATIMKGLALLVSSDKPMLDWRLRFEPPNSFIQPPFPLPEIKVQTVSVATTMGFSETLRKGGGFASRDRTEKIFLAGDGRASPRLILIDGHALASTPEAVQKGTTAGQLRVAIESVTSLDHNALGDAYGLHSIRLINREMANGWSNEPEQLLRVKGACYLAAEAMAAVGAMGVNTAIAHQVGAISQADHGAANAALLPHTIRFGAVEGADQLALVAEALGIEKTKKTAVHIADEIADRIALICGELGIPAKLRDLGVQQEHLELIAKATLGDFSLTASPRKVTSADDVMEILEQAY